MYNVVGDVGGMALTLKALHGKMPKDAAFLCLGDPNDRGPSSKEAIQYIMDNGLMVQSNHAHMMVEAWKQDAMPNASPKQYADGIWLQNGGVATLTSYGAHKSIDFWKHIPKNHITYLENLPMYIMTDSFFFSHAPLHSRSTIEQACDIGSGFASIKFDQKSENSLLWNRHIGKNKYLEGRINVFGHNSSSDVMTYSRSYRSGIKVKSQEHFNELLADKDDPVYGICLDTSVGEKLTGLHIPTMTLYEQKFID
jgi:hypothetical protein